MWAEQTLTGTLPPCGDLNSQSVSVAESSIKSRLAIHYFAFLDARWQPNIGKPVVKHHLIRLYRIKRLHYHASLSASGVARTWSLAKDSY